MQFLEGRIAGVVAAEREREARQTHAPQQQARKRRADRRAKEYVRWGTEGTSGNVVRYNLVVGNPPIVDIRNLPDAGTNTVRKHICLTALNAPCPTLDAFR